MIFIHVVIPVYNASQYIKECVDSVLKQRCGNQIDILLVDDGSTDGSGRICDELAENYENIYVVHQKNSGVSTARNVGIEYFINATGDNKNDSFLAFLDADDRWMPVFTDGVFDKIKCSDVYDVVAFGCVSSNETCLKFAAPMLYREETAEGGAEIIWRDENHVCANLYRVNFIKKYGIRFIDGLRYSEDKIFRMQALFLAEKVKFMPNLLYVHRQNMYSAMYRMKKMKAYEYYLPIIDGWIESDFFINQYMDCTNKVCNAGFGLASVYFGDLAKEHYKQWGSIKKLKKIRKHPYYDIFINMNEKWVKKKQFADHNLFLQHPFVYKIKYNFIGAMEYIAKSVIRIKPINAYRMKKRFSLSIDDIYKVNVK